MKIGWRSGGNGSPRPLDRVQDDIVAEMAGLADPIAQYEYLVAQARALPPPPDGLRAEAHAVPGCQTTVWIHAVYQDGRMHLAADSDAVLTRGLIALLLRVLDGRAPAEVLNAKLWFLDRTGLRTHLSPARANGLAAMIERIRACAAECDFASL